MEIVSAVDAVRLIASTSTVAVGGGGSLLQVPDNLLKALGENYSRTREPRDLTLIHTMGLGDNANRGLERLALPGLLQRVIGSHYGHNPRLSEMIAEGSLEAFAMPAGVLSLLYRDIAGGRLGHITRTGLGTFVDPRLDGGRLNASTSGSVANLITLQDREYLLYPARKLGYGLIRATASDLDGNLIMDDEAGFADNLALAMAVHACGGVVIAEVEYTTDRHSLDPRAVKVPGVLVDYVVVESDRWQTPITRYSPYRAGRFRKSSTSIDPLPLDARKVIARSAARELFPGAVVNLGYGVPTGIATILAEEDAAGDVVLTVEQGIFGGVPGHGLDSGTALNPEAFIDIGSQFEFYGGGGLDLCFVAFGEMDGRGNVNVSKLGRRAVGPGGFIDITQGAKSVVFCGTFTGGGLSVRFSPDGLVVDHEGSYRKFVSSVGQITFSGELAAADRRRVLVVTERAVLELSSGGLTVVEVAPGLDVERDVLRQMDCDAAVSPELRTMPEWLFSEESLRSQGVRLIRESNNT